MTVFLFEFMDQSWIPPSLHATLREVLEFHLEVPLSYYYRWAAQEALMRSESAGLSRIAEEGAGAAGFSETLAVLIRDQHKAIQVEISDLRPDPERYRQLETSFPGIIVTRQEPVDLTSEMARSPDVLYVMSGVFHHIPPGERERVLRSMATHSAMIFEPIACNVPSMIACGLGFLPAVLTPLYFFRRKVGRWRRFLWCWLIPVAPLMVAFDGVVSCLRCWTESEWRVALDKQGVRATSITIKKLKFSQMISW